MMKQRELLLVGTPSMAIRFARFEDVSGILRLIEGAVEHGCRNYYDERQRRSVYLGYASSLFVEVLGPFETLVAEIGGRLVGATQVDLRTGVLRALFVNAGFQGQGVGRAMLATIESRVRDASGKLLSGAMSLNAVEFYRRAGFQARGGVERLRGARTWVPVLWMEKLLATTSPGFRQALP
jgi:GNAT superfamily N-acetyltransferase